MDQVVPRGAQTFVDTATEERTGPHRGVSRDRRRANGRTRVTKTTRQRFVIQRRDWQTGIVDSAVGGFWSIENQLFDPEAIRDDEPQLRIIPIELLAHSKVSLSIRHRGRGWRGVIPHRFQVIDPQVAEPSRRPFYVVRSASSFGPASLFTNSHWASSLRLPRRRPYFGDLEPTDFGSPDWHLQTARRVRVGRRRFHRHLVAALRCAADGRFDYSAIRCALMAPVTCGMTSFGTAIDSW